MPKVSLPATVRVASNVYTIKAQPMEDYGQTDQRRLLITVADDVAPAVQRDTVLHEVLHGVYFAAGRIMPHDEDPDESAEQLIRLWTGPLLGVLRDNPDLVAYLTGDQ